MSGNRSRITYQFKKAGSQVETPVSDNSLYVDIGNALETGVIDHHQDRKEPGAISLAFSSTVKAFDPEYVKHLIGKDNIVVYTHSIVEYRRGNIDKAEEMLNTAQKFKEYCLDKGVLTVCNKLDALIVEKAADMPLG